MFIIFNLNAYWWYWWYCSSQASVVHILGDSEKMVRYFQMVLICSWYTSCRCGLSRGPLWAKPLPAANGSLTESGCICRMCDTVAVITSSNMWTLHDVARCSCRFRLHHAAPRIVYLQTPQGGGKTEQEARVQATAIGLNCKLLHSQRKPLKPYAIGVLQLFNGISMYCPFIHVCEYLHSYII